MRSRCVNETNNNRFISVIVVFSLKLPPFIIIFLHTKTKRQRRRDRQRQGRISGVECPKGNPQKTPRKEGGWMITISNVCMGRCDRTCYPSPNPTITYYNAQKYEPARGCESINRGTEMESYTRWNVFAKWEDGGCACGYGSQIPTRSVCPLPTLRMRDSAQIYRERRKGWQKKERKKGWTTTLTLLPGVCIEEGYYRERPWYRGRGTCSER